MENLKFNSLSIYCILLLYSAQGLTLEDPRMKARAPSCSNTNYLQFFPMEGSCVYFYVCYKGQSHIYKCPDKMLWNPSRQQCELAENVDCQDRTWSQRPAETQYNVGNSFEQTIGRGEMKAKSFDAQTQATLNALCKDAKTENVPHPTDCKKYIVCDFMAFVMPCPTGLFWNAELQLCDRQCVPPTKA